MYRILVIDDEKISFRGIKYMFESQFPMANEPYHVRTCSSALHELNTNEYDILILDMMLPTGEWVAPSSNADNLYGIDLLKEIRKIKQNIPIICYTVLNSDEIIDSIGKLNSFYICKNELMAREKLAKSINKIFQKKT